MAQYRERLNQQQNRAQQQEAQLQQDHRNAAYRFQQQYWDRVRRQQSQIQQNYDYNNDPYFYTAPSYRYYRGGNYYETNQYGVDALRQAVNYGYSEGYQAGQADQEDRWRFGYQNSYAYQDADYGYNGYYVDQSDYNYYFREGFQRGYEDGYYGRSQYGEYENGSYNILGSILSRILNLQPLE